MNPKTCGEIKIYVSPQHFVLILYIPEQKKFQIPIAIILWEFGILILKFNFFKQPNIFLQMVNHLRRWQPIFFSV